MLDIVTVQIVARGLFISACKGVDKHRDNVTLNDVGEQWKMSLDLSSLLSGASENGKGNAHVRIHDGNFNFEVW